ncbi:SPOR domain-containing protein [candidate division WOR-3 bacterium]|nr:SPOR domain-containing protein [candidate division WOR-3 bacterium]
MLQCHLFLVILGSTFLLDSNLYLVDVDRALATEIELDKPIVDFAADDFLYVTTEDCLYKIDPAYQRITDRTPLPVRFNHLVLGKQDIILISSDEIVLLDRRNLSFKTGIGIERGDHQPLVEDQRVADIDGRYHLYLQSDAGTRSRITILDLRSGKKIRELHGERMICTAYDPVAGTFAGIDAKKYLSVYDRSMKREIRTGLLIDPRTLSIHAAGLLIYSDQGVFLMDRNGKVADFQPLPGQQDNQGSVVLTDKAIVVIDTTVFRVTGWLTNDHAIVRLLPGTGTTHEFGADRSNNLFVIQKNPMTVTPLTLRRRMPDQIVTASKQVDSLWYVQLGAFSSRANAWQLHDELRTRGLPVFVDSADLYRVKFGGMTDKPSALHLAENLNLDGWFVFEQKIPGRHHEIFYIGRDKYIIDDGVVRKE